MPGRAVDFAQTSSLTALFLEQAETLADKPFLWAKRDGTYRSISWHEVRADVTAAASALEALGIRPGDRVVIVSENRPEWCMADLAIMACGGITVPVYTTNTTADHLHIFKDCEPAAIIISTGKLARAAMQAASQLRHPPLIILLDPDDLRQNPGLETTSWADLLRQGHGGTLPAPAALIQRTHSACIIYTSGTGGAPKGVLLSHGAIIANCMGAYALLMRLGLDDEVFLSFLPLSHAYEHTAGQFFPMSIGAQIYYAESLDALSGNLIEARPTIMTAVPRLYEVLRQKIMRGMERQSASKKAWFNRTLDLGGRAYEDPASLTLGEKILNWLCGILVRRKVAGRFGGRLKAFVSGGAPLNYDVGLFFTALGIRIVQGYGQTEAAPVISANVPLKEKLATVGPPLEGVELNIAEDGEICVRGELVMRGYWNHPEATAKVIDSDGWLHTGDIGTLDEDGYLTITDRKKDIIVNSGGDNISPQRIEGFLTLESAIAQAMVFGDRRPHLVALLVPDPDFVNSFAIEHATSTDVSVLANDSAFRKAISHAVNRTNQGLSNIEKIRKFTIAAEPFSIDNEMLTPTLKIRRHVIRQHYGDALNALYE